MQLHPRKCGWCSHCLALPSEEQGSARASSCSLHQDWALCNHQAEWGSLSAAPEQRTSQNTPFSHRCLSLWVTPMKWTQLFWNLKGDQQMTGKKKSQIFKLIWTDFVLIFDFITALASLETRVLFSLKSSHGCRAMGAKAKSCATDRTRYLYLSHTLTNPFFELYCVC